MMICQEYENNFAINLCSYQSITHSWWLFLNRIIHFYKQLIIALEAIGNSRE